MALIKALQILSSLKGHSVLSVRACAALRRTQHLTISQFFYTDPLQCVLGSVQG